MALHTLLTINSVKSARHAK